MGDLLDIAGGLAVEWCRASVLESLAPMVVAAGLMPEAVALAPEHSPHPMAEVSERARN